jgi:hypothetical protein
VKFECLTEEDWYFVSDTLIAEIQALCDCCYATAEVTQAYPSDLYSPTRKQLEEEMQYNLEWFHQVEGPGKERRKERKERDARLALVVRRLQFMN